MIGQSLGSVYLGWEALCKFTPLYYFHTSGYAYTYPVARVFGCKWCCAVASLDQFRYAVSSERKERNVQQRRSHCLEELPLERSSEVPKIISFAHFRFEKVGYLLRQ